MTDLAGLISLDAIVHATLPQGVGVRPQRRLPRTSVLDREQALEAVAHTPLQEGVGDYVGESGGGLTPAGFVEGARGFENPHGCYLFRWGLGEVVTALAGAGLTITALEEYPYANGERHFAGMRELPGRRMVPPEEVPAVPLMYGIRAELR